MVRKVRNPTAHPGFALKKLWQRLRRNPKNPRLDLHLNHCLHPNLRVKSLIFKSIFLLFILFLIQNPSDLLEKRVLQFEIAVETLLAQHGREVSTKQMDLRRVADVAIDLFAMTAVLSRSSRAYCIGLRNAEHEVNYFNVKL
jgi:acyl-CoA dehydrogenase family protein 9